MRILFVSDTYYPHLNGVYYFVSRLAPLLQERGHEVAVIAPSETTLPTLKKIDGFDVYGVPSLPTVYYPKVRFAVPFFLKSRIRSVLNEFRPDIIHVQDHFQIGNSTIQIGNAMGIPVIGTNHFMTENLTSFFHSQRGKRIVSNLLWKKFERVYNQVRLVTTPSTWAVNLIQPRLKNQVLAVSSGIDLQGFNPVGSCNSVKKKFSIPCKPILLFVGRLDPEKKIGETLLAVSQALQYLDFCFVIVGKGIQKQSLEKQAEKLGIKNNIIFTGFVTDEELPYIYKLSNCFIISSTAELLSLSAIQGMAAGLPIIAVNAGALGELISPGENGYLYQSGDTQFLVACIIRILGNPVLAKQMKQKSLELVSRHDIHDTVISFESIYEKTLEPALNTKYIQENKLKFRIWNKFKGKIEYLFRY